MNNIFHYDLLTKIAVIRGKCRDFVCRGCFTKFGWDHQPWCPDASLEEPECTDCRYYDAQTESCDHPARKTDWRNTDFEEDKGSL